MKVLIKNKNNLTMAEYDNIVSIATDGTEYSLTTIGGTTYTYLCSGYWIYIIY